MPDEGANAFLAACDLALRVHALEETVFSARDPLFAPDRTTIQPTKKEANVPNVNTIPGEDVFHFDMRILPRYSIDSVLAEVSKAMREVEKAYGVKMEYEVAQRSESKATAADSPVVARAFGGGRRGVRREGPRDRHRRLAASRPTCATRVWTASCGRAWRTTRTSPTRARASPTSSATPRSSPRWRCLKAGRGRRGPCPAGRARDFREGRRCGPRPRATG